MRAIPGKCEAERGLTLVELLVVLAIVAVMAGAVALAIGGGGGGDRALESEAVRLATRLRLAADDVRLDERPLALAWDGAGYAFVDWDAARQAWLPDRLTALGRHRLPAGMTLAVPGARTPLPISGDATGAPIVARLAARDARWTVRFDGLDAQAARGGA